MSRPRPRSPNHKADNRRIANAASPLSALGNGQPWHRHTISRLADRMTPLRNIRARIAKTFFASTEPMAAPSCVLHFMRTSWSIPVLDRGGMTRGDPRRLEAASRRGWSCPCPYAAPPCAAPQANARSHKNRRRATEPAAATNRAERTGEGAVQAAPKQVPANLNAARKELLCRFLRPDIHVRLPRRARQGETAAKSQRTLRSNTKPSLKHEARRSNKRTRPLNAQPSSQIRSPALSRRRVAKKTAKKCVTRSRADREGDDADQHPRTPCSCLLTRRVTIRRQSPASAPAAASAIYFSD